jgi:acyl-CoA thioesterase
MATFSTLEEAQACFVNDRFATGNGCVLEEVGEDYAVASVVIRDEHRNGLGGVMGGLIFTLADFASAALANHLHRPTVAQQVSVNFLNPPKGERLNARAEVKKSGKSSTVINVDVCDEAGREVMQFVGTGFKL